MQLAELPDPCEGGMNEPMKLREEYRDQPPRHGLYGGRAALRLNEREEPNDRSTK